MPSYLMRPIIPSWRFFDKFIQAPQLYYRLIIAQQEPQDWSLCLRPKARKWHSLFYNPTGNYYLACRSLLEQLLSELSSWPEEQLADFDNSVSFKLVEQLVQFETKKMQQELSARAVQFRITSISYQGTIPVEQDVLISKPILCS